MRWATWPNLITLLRLCLVPFIIILLLPDRMPGLAFATVLLGVAFVSDGLDGWVARRYDQESALGRTGDAFVDGILLLSVLIVYVLDGLIPWWLMALFLLRELIVLGTRVRWTLLGQPKGADWIGKFKLILMVAVIAYAQAFLMLRATGHGFAWGTQTLLGALLFVLVLSGYRQIEWAVRRIRRLVGLESTSGPGSRS